MLKRVAEFLEKYWDRKSPLLLGYSGGPDSKALLYALLEAGCKTLHLAHVDHGWRLESEGEAKDLAQEAKHLGLPFHTTRIHLISEGNKEATARQARLSFFQMLFETVPFQALLLAHQAGDVAETSLKRILEGAHLPFLGGMEPTGTIYGMNIWRPLFSVRREEIMGFLEAKHLKPLIDPTNFDPAYLRARMRTEILPYLRQLFGKEIDQNLLLLSQRAAELKRYLENKTKIYTPKHGPWGLFGYLGNLERVEVRYLLQKWAEIEQIHLPRTLLEIIIDALASNVPNRCVGPRVFVDRGYVFFLSATPPSWGADPLQLMPGLWTWGDWTIEVKKSKDPEKKVSGWQEVWSGCFIADVPRGYLSMPLVGTRFRQLWNKKKVPAFFRYQVPVVLNELGEVKEFLTGKNLPQIESYFKLVITNCSVPTL